MANDDARFIAISWIYGDQFGFERAPSITEPEVTRNMALSLLAADGYQPGEAAAVRSMARALGIDEIVVTKIEEQVAAEDALKKKRLQLLMPDGHPNLKR